MMAAEGAVHQGQASKKIIAFGGTGKTVALIYLKIGKLLGERANIVVCDFLPSGNYNSPDGKLDRDLADEGVGQQFRVSTMPDEWPMAPNSLADILKMPPTVADALFSQRQQDTPPTEGLNQEPQVGATVSCLKVAADGDKIRSRCLGEPEIFLVAGLGGGTGTGVTPTFAKFLRSWKPNSRLHGVFLLPWQDIGDNEVGNAGQERNAKSLLSYLRDHGNEYFDTMVVIGSCQGVQQYSSGSGGGKGRPIHPTLILAALYIHMWHQLGGGAQLVAPLNKMETRRSGIALTEITGRNGSLHDMLVHSKRVEDILSEIVDQSPDERLAWFSLYPISAPLSWASTEWLLKLYCQYVKARSYGSAWGEIRARLQKVVEQEGERRTWIMGLAKEPSLFQFDESQIEGDARTRYDAYRDAVMRDDAYREFRFKAQEKQAALEEICGFIYNTVANQVLATMKLRRK